MAKINQSSFREKQIDTIDGQVIQVDFLDVDTNSIYITNKGNGNIYVGYNSLVDKNRYDFLISPKMITPIVRPSNIKSLYIFSESVNEVYIQSFYSENLQPSDIPYTQTTIVLHSDSLSITDINRIINPLPTGSNKIGVVGVDSLPTTSRPSSLPTIKNLNIVNPNQEYSYVIPNGTKKISLTDKTFDESNVVKIYFSSGAVETFDINGGMEFYEDEIYSSNLTLYVKCSKPCTLQIMSWRV